MATNKEKESSTSTAATPSTPSITKDISGPSLFQPPPDRESIPARIASQLYPLATHPSVAPYSGDGPPPGETPITVVCISDTHNTQPFLPDGDLLLHAGDISEHGTFDEIQAQLIWLNSQPHAHKVVIAGNHDLILDPEFVKAHPNRELDKPGKSCADLDWGSIHYLDRTSLSLTIHGRTLKIYGSPMTPNYGSWAFQYSTDDDVWKDTIPKDTDILLTHGPSALHIGARKGCSFLFHEIFRVRPRLAVYGHIHEAHGEETFEYDPADMCLANAKNGYGPWGHCAQLLGMAMTRPVTRLWRTPRGVARTHFVNAAVVKGMGNRERMEAIVVRL